MTSVDRRCFLMSTKILHNEGSPCVPSSGRGLSGTAATWAGCRIKCSPLQWVEVMSSKCWEFLKGCSVPLSVWGSGGVWEGKGWGREREGGEQESCSFLLNGEKEVVKKSAGRIQHLWMWIQDGGSLVGRSESIRPFDSNSNIFKGSELFFRWWQKFLKAAFSWVLKFL